MATPLRTLRDMSGRGISSNPVRHAYRVNFEDKKEHKKLLMPAEVKYSLLNGSAQMVFLDTIGRDRFTENELEFNYRNEFPNVHNVMHEIENNARVTKYGLFQFHMTYRKVSDKELQRNLPFVKSMAVSMILDLSEGTSSGIDPFGGQTCQEYIDKLPTTVEAFWQRNPKRDIVFILNSKIEEERDSAEEKNFISLLRTLSTLMLDSDPVKPGLKVIAIFNQYNKLWDQFFKSTDNAEDAKIRSVCTAHKFDKETGWSCLWPKQDEEQ